MVTKIGDLDWESSGSSLDLPLKEVLEDKASVTSNELFEAMHDRIKELDDWESPSKENEPDHGNRILPGANGIGGKGRRSTSLHRYCRASIETNYSFVLDKAYMCAFAHYHQAIAELS